MDILTLGESGEGVLIRLNDSPVSIPVKTPGVAFLAPEGQAEIRNLLCFGPLAVTPLRVWDPATFVRRHRVSFLGEGVWRPSPISFHLLLTYRATPHIRLPRGSYSGRPGFPPVPTGCSRAPRASRIIPSPLWGTNAYGARFFVGVRRVYRPLPLLTRTSIIGSPYWEALQPRPPTLFVDVDGNGRKNLLLSPFLLVRQKTYYNIK